MNVFQLEALIRMAHARSINPELKQDWDTVVIDLEHSGRQAPGQLRYTDEFREQTYAYWPKNMEELE